jgi:hypothetical protein
MRAGEHADYDRGRCGDPAQDPESPDQDGNRAAACLLLAKAASAQPASDWLSVREAAGPESIPARCYER